MKSLGLSVSKTSSVVIFCMLLVSQQHLLAQKGEVPITTASKEARMLFLQGRDKSDNIEFAAAAPLFDQAIQKDTNFAMAYLYRAQSGGGFNVFRKNLEKAVSLVDKVSPGEKHWILSAQAGADVNQAKQKEHLDQLLKLFPSDKRVHLLLGNFYNFSVDSPSSAMQHYTKATDLDKNYAAAYNLIGYRQMFSGNYTAAEDAFKKYIELRPESPNPYDSYAEFLLKMGRYDESITQYKKALEKDPAFTGSLTGIGNNYIFKGDYEKAREYYQQQFVKAPNTSGRIGALFFTSASYLHEGKTAKALEVLDEIRALAEKENLTPSVIGAYNTAGFILAESGSLAEAVKQYEKASKLREESNLPAPVKENARLGAMMTRCRILTSVHEFEAAKGLAEKCRATVELRKNPNEERNLNAILAMMELEQGNNDKALEYFSKADKEDPYNWYYTAIAYEGKGDKENASKWYSKIMNWNQNNVGYAIIRPRAMARMSK